MFDQSLKPSVVDEAGKQLSDVPKPKSSDDAERAASAVEAWKALKKDARTIAAAQVLRLEHAMCAQRRWSTPVFRQFLFGHPLLIHLVRRLVWACYDANGVVTHSFRVAEDGSLASDADDRFELADEASIGIAHPLELGTELCSRWGQLIADYEILQPFEQLARQAMTPTSEEQGATELARVRGLKLPTGKVLGLDQRGWRRGPPEDAGVVNWYEKPIQPGLTVFLALDPGIYTGSIADSPEQTLGAVTLFGRYSGIGETYSFERLTPVAFSELLRDLESLRS
ncbi:MAG: DUF4132 domain-containing protein [Polyangiaceae bacterium]